jgi:O-antigen ligase
MVIGGLWFWVAMAMSRTGWLAAPIVIGVTSWLLLRRGQVTKGTLVRVLGTAVLVVVVLIAGMLVVDTPFVGGDLDLQFAFRFSQGWDLLADITGLFEGSERFADRFNLSEERADVWPEYLAMFKANPWLGVGLSVGWQTNSIGQEPHNLFLELLAEIGVVGLIAFLGLVLSILRLGAGLVGTAALTAAFLPSITQTVLFEPIWWFAGALFIAGRGDGEGLRAPATRVMAKGSGPPPELLDNRPPPAGVEFGSPQKPGFEPPALD